MNIDLTSSQYAQKAMNLFKEGYNCSQSVFLAFKDLYGIDRHTALKLSSSFGGGMGRLREVCGSVSGMFLTAGICTDTTHRKTVPQRQSTTNGFRNSPAHLKN